MKKSIISLALLLIAASVSGQGTFNLRDSTIEFMSGFGGSKTPQKLRALFAQELDRNTSSSLKMIVFDSSAFANATPPYFYYQDIPTGGGGGGTPGGSDKSFQYNNSSSFAGSGNVSQETNYTKIIGSSTSVTPIQVYAMTSQSASIIRLYSEGGAGDDSVFSVDALGNTTHGRLSGTPYTRRHVFNMGIGNPATDGLRLIDGASGNGVSLFPVSGNFLTVRNSSTGATTGVSIASIYNPNNGLEITAGSDYWAMGLQRLSVNKATAPDASSIFEVSGTTGGLLVPRMTSTQASAISSPADGNILYVTDTNGTFTSVGFWGRENGAWVKL